MHKNARTAAIRSPLAAMARAALSVVYAHERDDELAALHARVAELERSIEYICWFDRMRQAVCECEDSNNYLFMINKVRELLVWPIEQQHWGVREGVAPGLLNFHREHALERFVMELLVSAVQNDDLRPVEYYMRRAEDALSLPRGLLARLPADAEFR